MLGRRLQCADNVAIGNPEKPHIKFSTELKGHLGSVEKVAFNPTKDAELCSISSDGVAKFWDVRTKACFNEVKGLGEAFTLAWAPDGQSLIVGNKVRTPPPLISSPISHLPGQGAMQGGWRELFGTE